MSCDLTDEDKLLIAECRAERLRMMAELPRFNKQIDQTKRRYKKQMSELAPASLAKKFGVSESTIRLIPAADL